jgi:hypothetical protein
MAVCIQILLQQMILVELLGPLIRNKNLIVFKQFAKFDKMISPSIQLVMKFQSLQLEKLL